MKKTSLESIDEYIAGQPATVQPVLQKIREVIAAAAPDATERISYQMPAFYLNGNLVYFAACANHIGLYPTASGVARFQEELSGYKHSKGAIQFPIDKPMPLALIRKIVKFRVEENKAGAREPARRRRSL